MKKYNQFLNEEVSFIKKIINSITGYIEKIRENNRKKAEEERERIEEELRRERDEENRKNRANREYRENLDRLAQNAREQQVITNNLHRLLIDMRNDFIRGSRRDKMSVSRVDLTGSDGVGYIGSEMKYTMDNDDIITLVYVPGSRIRAKLYHIRSYGTTEYEIIPINANHFINLFNEMARM